jgi:stalled ribosome rescue protein Dom34
MPNHYHAVVWIDHREARVFHFNLTDIDRLVLHPHNPTQHLHHKAGSISSGHAPEDQNFFHAVAKAIAGAKEVLITGPANAKAEFMKHIEHHDPALAKIVAGVETVDHPSDNALVAHARKYFKAADRMRSQKS